MDPIKLKAAKLRTRQLDELFSALTPYLAQMPQGTWIKDIRLALGMSATQMARLVGISKPTLSKMERNEASKAITLRTLQKIAYVMNCRLIYAFVPQPGLGSLAAILKERAQKVATRLIDRTSHTMALESQAVSEVERISQINDLADDLVRTLDKRLWDVDV